MIYVLASPGLGKEAPSPMPMAVSVKIITDSQCLNYGQAGHPEQPGRVSASVELLKAQADLRLDWLTPPLAEMDICLRAHTPELFERLLQPLDFEEDTPAYAGIIEHAYRAAGAALLAMETALNGELAFSLMRPPGHHATTGHAMGFCYLNNMAIAVLQARVLGTERVAVLDFDVHHGNGTEDILWRRDGSAYYSIHEHPLYPGTGRSSHANVSNYLLAPHTSRLDYRSTWNELLDEVGQFKPNLIGVSAGFDAFKGDPLGHQQLEPEDYYWLGSTLQQLDRPVFCVLEGGYSQELPQLILAFVQGLQSLNPKSDTVNIQPAG